MANNRELSQFANVVGYNGGNIGIGTDNPARSLDVRSGNSTDVVQFSNDSGNKVTFGVSSTQTSIDLLSSKSFRIRSGSDNRFNIATDGKIGINEIDPSSQLHIKGNNNLLRLETTASTGTNYMEFYDASARKGYIGYGSGSNETLYFVNEEVGNFSFYTTPSGGSLTERLRITSEGHKWTVNGSLFHGSSDYSDFTDASRNSYNNVSVRAGYAGGDSTPTNRTSAIKIYPAGTRNNAVGTLTGGVAWQHLDINNGSWGSSYGDGAQIWMGAAIHDVPGQERDRFNLWMNSSTVAGSNPNNLAIEAYPNGMVRHPKVPAFHAKGGTSLTNNTNVIIVSSSTEFNNGSCYSTSNGRFTAPIDGIYYFSFWGLLYPHASGVINIFYFRNGTQYGHLVQGGADSNNHTSRAGSIMMSMSAGDYAELRINRGSNTGVNAYGSQWNMCGFLVG